MDVQLRHLRALVAIVDTGTFTDAATELGVSQAAVSRSVAALEEALGVRVLQRTTRHVTLTGTGAQVLAAARRILDEVTHLSRLAQRQRSELRIGYAWAVLGKHTRRLQRTWAALHAPPHAARARPGPLSGSNRRPHRDDHARPVVAGPRASTCGSPGGATIHRSTSTICSG